MKKLLPLALGAALVAAAPALSRADDMPGGAKATAEAEWFADFDKARESAKAQRKPMLVDFTGSDWCGWCIKLHNEVFDTPQFRASAPSDFVLVVLDYPHNAEAKAKVPNEARNAELAGKYRVQGFPTVLVITPEGDVIARGGYGAGGPEAWLTDIRRKTADGRVALAPSMKLRAEFDATPADKAAERAAITDRAIAAMEAASKADGPVGTLASIVHDGASLDPENKSGMKVRALRALFVAGESTGADLADAVRVDPKNENGVREHVVATLWMKVMNGADPVPFVEEGAALAATGNLKDPEVYVNGLANSAGIAMDLAGKAKGAGDAAKADALTKKAQTIAQTLKDKGPKGNPRLDQFVAKILSGDLDGEDEDHDGHDHK